jgi:CheY-like chemotaxis protein
LLSSFVRPDINGYEASTRIRLMEKEGKDFIEDNSLSNSNLNNPHKSHIPIVALTASHTPADNKIYRDAGIDYLLVKPFTKKQIKEIVNNFIDHPDKNSLTPMSQ